MRRDWSDIDRLDSVRICDAVFFDGLKILSYAVQIAIIHRNDHEMALKWLVLVDFLTHRQFHRRSNWFVGLDVRKHYNHTHLIVKENEKPNKQTINIWPKAVAIYFYGNYLKKKNIPEVAVNRMFIKHVVAKEIKMHALQNLMWALLIFIVTLVRFFVHLFSILDVDFIVVFFPTIVYKKNTMNPKGNCPDRRTEMKSGIHKTQIAAVAFFVVWCNHKLRFDMRVSEWTTNMCAIARWQLKSSKVCSGM